MLTAELTWLRHLIDDLRAGRVTWSEELLRASAEMFLPAAEEPEQEETR